MNKRSLVIGMGIGQLYKTVLENIGHTVITVDMDPSKGAEFTSVADAIRKYSIFDTAHICTPNFTHKDIAEQVAPYTKIVFVEKPGFKTSNDWTGMIKTRPFTRFMMVKNNMWRDNIVELKDLANKSKKVNLNWINKDRIPNPGSWFTNKELAFGGVSRDLMPHLLSWFIALAPDWIRANLTKQTAFKRWTLGQLTGTDYGTVNVNGTYDVDDFCQINFTDKWQLTADWRDLKSDKRNIEFVMEDDSVITVELGLCPEYAYQNMISDAIKNIDNQTFWLEQYKQDSWIHERIENL
jgi:predicted dehydrogenase